MLAVGNRSCVSQSSKTIKIVDKYYIWNLEQQRFKHSSQTNKSNTNILISVKLVLFEF